MHAKKDSIVTIQSVDFFDGTGIPKYILQINSDFTFTSFCCGSKCFIKTLTSNDITKIDTKSCLEEALNYLQSLTTISKID